MPKSNSDQLDNFYETANPAAPLVDFPAAPTHPITDQAADLIGTGWKHLLPVLRSGRKHLGPVIKSGWKLIDAAAQDSWRYGRVIAAKAGNRTARRIYAWLLLANLLGAAVVGVLIANVTFTTYAADIANPASLLNHKKTGTTILDRNGETLFEVYGASTRHYVDINELPPELIKATLAAEDPHFYDHPGFSWRSTGRAVFQDLKSRGKLQGGSTITQQLVKNALLSPEKSYIRKYQEILLSIEMERRYNKDQILQMYFNQIYYGQGSYGIEAASQTYFHKPARDLNLSESALLAGLPLGPSRFDPNLDIETATERRDFILDQMQALGFAEKNQVEAAKTQPIVAAARQITIQAPHFVFYVLDELRRQYGDEVVERGGITVYTSLDLAKQRVAEQIVKNQVAKLAPQHATNGGLISIDSTTGEILAMVGSIDYNQPTFGKVNVTLSQLQPGSSFKPFAYATAFKKGWNGAVQVDDQPVSLPGGDGSIYRPQNYDQRFRGKVLLRRALANSLNIPAIHVLQYAGIHDTIQTAHDLGITTLNDESRYGLSLVLGGGEVRPIDMAGAFASLANQGVKVHPNGIQRVLDRRGKNITKSTSKTPEQVLDPRIAYMLTNILSDNQARTEIFGPNSPLKLSRPAAVKTGTTNDFRDNWTVGFTPEITTAVWVGNNDHSPMHNVDGITGAAPIWHNYMEWVHQGIEPQQFSVPAGLVTAKVCSRDGGLANPWDQGIDEYFLAEAKPTKQCHSEAPKPPEPQPTEPDQPTDPNLDQAPNDQNQNSQLFENPRRGRNQGN